MLRNILTLSLLLVVVSGIKLNNETRMFVDDYGRTVIFHGVNVVVKQPPYIPILDYFDPQMSLTLSDIQNLTKWGFNFVRLGVMWEAVEWEFGQYNYTYLQNISSLITTLGENGIWTLVDNHQDAFARSICGEGVPDFYAKNLSDNCSGIFGKAFEDLKACTPFSKFNITKLPDGDPVLSQCTNRSFVEYYFTPEAADGFQRLYENIDGFQDRFAAFWNVVSQFFANNSYVVGYDIINEPFAANIVTQPWTLLPGVNDLVNLQPLYKRIHGVIRENDEEKVIFFEPIQGDAVGVFGGLVFPVGFNDTPGGVPYNDRQILNDHSYCCQAGATYCQNGEPADDLYEICSEFNHARVASRKVDADNLGVGLIISEFGACFDTMNCVNETTSVTSACDDNLVGWAYWMFKGYGDFTTSANLQEGFYNSSVLQTNKVKALARTYAPYYQGVPLSIFFNPATGYFKTEFTLDPSVTANTVVFASSDFYYLNQTNIFITSSNAAVSCGFVYDKPNYYNITCSPLAASNITIIITP